MSRVVHFEIQADDVERAKAFYAAVFDWSFAGLRASHRLDLLGDRDRPDEAGAALSRHAVWSPTACFRVGNVRFVTKRGGVARGWLADDRQRFDPPSGLRRRWALGRSAAGAAAWQGLAVRARDAVVPGAAGHAAWSSIVVRRLVRQPHGFGRKPAVL